MNEKETVKFVEDIVSFVEWQDDYESAFKLVEKTIQNERKAELFRINKKMQEYVHANNLRGFQIWLNKECEKSK